MSQDKLRYPEKHIQLGFLEWYTKNNGYIEKIDDIEGFKGSPMDSIGFIGDRPILIEFKHLISAKMVFHDDSPASSLELKIVRALKSLYEREETCFAGAMSSWNKKTVPMIVIIAKSISTGALEKLKAFDKSYSSAWQFSLALYEWDGRTGTLCYENIISDSTFTARLPDLPKIKAIAPTRPKGLCVDDVRRLLEEKALSSVFDAFLHYLLKLEGKADPGKYQSNLNFKLMDAKAGKFLTVAGVWPYQSNSEKGLLFSYNTNNLEQVLGATKELFYNLPGVDGPIVGYQNSHRYLRSVEEVNQFWNALSGSKESAPISDVPVNIKNEVLAANKRTIIPILNDEEAYEFGRQSNIPHCCCVWFINVWTKYDPRRKAIKNHVKIMHERYNAFSPDNRLFDYIPCPVCLEKGTFNELVKCSYVKPETENGKK